MAELNVSAHAITDPAGLLERLSNHRTLAGAPITELEWLVARGVLFRLEPGPLDELIPEMLESLLVLLSGHFAIFVDHGAGPHKVMEWFHRQYVGDNPPRHDPFYAPLLGTLHGFPPSVVVVGTLDPLLDDSRLFAAALEKAGVPVDLHVYEDGIHAFLQMAMLDMCGDAITKIAAFARAKA